MTTQSFEALSNLYSTKTKYEPTCEIQGRSDRIEIFLPDVYLVLLPDGHWYLMDYGG